MNVTSCITAWAEAVHNFKLYVNLSHWADLCFEVIYVLINVGSKNYKAVPLSSPTLAGAGSSPGP